VPSSLRKSSGTGNRYDPSREGHFGSPTHRLQEGDMPMGQPNSTVGMSLPMISRNFGFNLCSAVFGNQCSGLCAVRLLTTSSLNSSAVISPKIGRRNAPAPHRPALEAPSHGHGQTPLKPVDASGEPGHRLSISASSTRFSNTSGSITHTRALRRPSVSRLMPICAASARPEENPPLGYFTECLKSVP
jgi:hypothetical protein